MTSNDLALDLPLCFRSVSSELRDVSLVLFPPSRDLDLDLALSFLSAESSTDLDLERVLRLVLVSSSSLGVDLVSLCRLGDREPARDDFLSPRDELSRPCLDSSESTSFDFLFWGLTLLLLLELDEWCSSDLPYLLLSETSLESLYDRLLPS